MGDLERADTFTGYNNMANDAQEEEILDEEHWNWPVLLTRVLCFFLLFAIIVCVVLEAISPRFLVLAAIICGFLVLVVIATYIDPRKWFSIICRRREQQEPTPARRVVTTVTNPLQATRSGIISPRAPPNGIPSRSSNVAVPATVVNGNPIQMVERNSYVAPPLTNHTTPSATSTTTTATAATTTTTATTAPATIQNQRGSRNLTQP